MPYFFRMCHPERRTLRGPTNDSLRGKRHEESASMPQGGRTDFARANQKKHTRNNLLPHPTCIQFCDRE